MVIHRVVLFIAHKYLDGHQFTHETSTNPTSFTWMIFQVNLGTQKCAMRY